MIILATVYPFPIVNQGCSTLLSLRDKFEWNWSFNNKFQVKTWTDLCDWGWPLNQTHKRWNENGVLITGWLLWWWTPHILTSFDLPLHTYSIHERRNVDDENTHHDSVVPVQRKCHHNSFIHKLILRIFRIYQTKSEISNSTFKLLSIMCGCSCVYVCMPFTIEKWQLEVHKMR